MVDQMGVDRVALNHTNCHSILTSQPIKIKDFITDRKVTINAKYRLGCEVMLSWTLVWFSFGLPQ